MPIETSHNQQGGIIRKITVGVLAIATVAAASLLLKKTRPHSATAEEDAEAVNVHDLYAAGL